MKKRILFIGLMTLGLVSINFNSVEESEAQGFNYESVQTMSLHGLKVCFVTKCTNTNGSDCTTPGAKSRVCIDVIGIL
tara:strand:- start:1580 stop:1813 length:234 start_codon:yes stop_codon:yes gene_type:complete